jgi:hypothetical protein
MHQGTGSCSSGDVAGAHHAVLSGGGDIPTGRRQLPQAGHHHPTVLPQQGTYPYVLHYMLPANGRRTSCMQMKQQDGPRQQRLEAWLEASSHPSIPGDAQLFSGGGAHMQQMQGCY